MEQFIQEAIPQLGAIGIMLAGAFFLVKKLLAFNYKQLEEKEVKIGELNEQFNKYLIDTQAKLLEIISKNTDSYEKMIASYDKNTNNIIDAFNNNTDTINKLGYSIEFNICKNESNKKN
jgi:hypothetical protein